MSDANIRNLVCAIVFQAAKDFLNGTERQRQTILKDLRSPYMDMLSNGTSIIVSEQLEKHPKEIAVRLHKYGDVKKWLESEVTE